MGQSRSVGDVLQETPITVVEGHLTWLVARTRREPQLSPQRVLFEDQSKILIDALEVRGEHDVITRTIAGVWMAEDVTDDEERLAEYAAGLDGATAGQPRHSPYAALAQSAARFCTEVVKDRAGARRAG
ncbi:MAG TPA: hypothetical protein VMB72_15640 [Acidimicrobiales bacterium]|nr:hypothetical protein [Acidimicrobiales bacterium]